MADAKQHQITHQQLLTDALDLLGDMQHRMGMFENQDYWKIKLKAEVLNQKATEEDK
ncbi:hypothetical protein ACFQZS_16205 [Mucilaginibacter calamicampi]|uniref:Uncharacterized protein n=1 Tax=Mucilaginibacter calamicampi TaxID=1302352 RepID=A0ABW2Z0T5_9SPHI